MPYILKRVRAVSPSGFQWLTWKRDPFSGASWSDDPHQAVEVPSWNYAERILSFHREGFAARIERPKQLSLF